jgi:hypothetical protein
VNVVTPSGGCWRSRQNWTSRTSTAGWEHKRPYLRSLNLKAVLPQAQTLPIVAMAGAAIVFAGMEIDAVASAINALLSSLTFVPEMSMDEEGAGA